MTHFSGRQWNISQNSPARNQSIIDTLTALVAEKQHAIDTLTARVAELERSMAVVLARTDMLMTAAGQDDGYDVVAALGGAKAE